jgi:RNA polymerase sigma-70 factor (ECF subfamily)
LEVISTTISTAGIPFSVPPPDVLPERLAAVLAVVYLIFNEGYDRAPELAAEAIRLGRVLTVLLPAESEISGLLALMVLHEARRQARFDGQDLVLLQDQDRSRWNWPDIEEGRAILDRLDLRSRPAGPYAIQAVIAALQTEERLDWLRIAALYGALADLTGSPVVTLNRAVAVAEADGPAVALAMVDELDLPDYQYWHSTRAELLRRLGRADQARAAYQEALSRARTDHERRFLESRIANL